MPWPPLIDVNYRRMSYQAGQCEGMNKQTNKQINKCEIERIREASGFLLFHSLIPCGFVVFVVDFVCLGLPQGVLCLCDID